MTPSHLTESGFPCALRPDHTGQHRTVLGIAHRREYDRTWTAANRDRSRQLWRESKRRQRSH
jgi:hypothetical protein